jgi:hypothetical protein
VDGIGRQSQVAQPGAGDHEGPALQERPERVGEPGALVVGQVLLAQHHRASPAVDGGGDDVREGTAAEGCGR